MRVCSAAWQHRGPFQASDSTRVHIGRAAKDHGRCHSNREASLGQECTAGWRRDGGFQFPADTVAAIVALGRRNMEGCCARWRAVATWALVCCAHTWAGQRIGWERSGKGRRQLGQGQGSKRSGSRRGSGGESAFILLLNLTSLTLAHLDHLISLAIQSRGASRPLRLNMRPTSCVVGVAAIT